MADDTVTLPRAVFEQMHALLVDYKFELCGARCASAFKRDEKIVHLKKLQATNEPEFFSTPYGVRGKRLRKAMPWLT